MKKRICEHNNWATLQERGDTERVGQHSEANCSHKSAMPMIRSNFSRIQMGILQKTLQRNLVKMVKNITF
jgi:hypothetical protein